MKRVYAVLMVILCLVILFPPAFAASLSVPLGEEVPLTGTSTGSQTVYLFLTGPNLAANGIRLSDGAPVVTGSSSSFTRVDVMTDNTWRYDWDTGGLGGIIDVGSYTVYVVDEPAGKQDLAGKEFATVHVSLTRGSISVLTAPPAATTRETTPASTTPVTMTARVPTGSPEGEAATPASVLPVPGILPLAAVLFVLVFVTRRMA